MPIQDSDLLLIEDTSGTSKKITASHLKANLAANTYNNHKLLVNKPDYSSRFVYAQNMQASVGLTDYMLVERGGTSYKVTGQQIIDYFPSVPAGAAGGIASVTKTKVTFDSSINDTQDWLNSGSLTGTDAAATQFLFDNIETTAAQGRAKDLTWNFNSPIIAYKSLALRGSTEDNTNTNWMVNGSAVSERPVVYSGNSNFTTTPITSISFPITLTKVGLINATSGAAGQGCRFSMIIVDGKPLAQPGVQGVDLTEVVSQELTMAGTTNLDLFTEGDAIRMVNTDGNVSEYTPISSTITNLTTVSGWNQDQTWSNGGSGGLVTNGSTTDIFKNGNVYDSPYFGGRPSGFYFNIGSGITAYNKLEVACWSERHDATSLIINGSIISKAHIPKSNENLPGAGLDNKIKVSDLTFPLTITSIGMTGGGSGDGGRFYAVYVDGRRLIDPSYSIAGQDPTEDPNYTRLSFASPNDDLALINNAGTVAQPGSLTTNAQMTANTSNFPGNMNVASEAQISKFYSGLSTYNSGPNLRPVADGLQFANTYIVNSSLRLKITSEDNTNTTLVLNGSMTSDTVARGIGVNCGNPPRLDSNAPWNDVSSFIPSFPFELKNIGLYGGSPGGGSFWTAIEIDGVQVQGGSAVNAKINLEVLSCNIPSNTLMLPENGSWTASNGTTSGNATFRQTTASTDPQSGTGIIQSISGAVVEINNVTDSFIPITNRLNEPFFIKAASTRTGLAIMRTKAIAEAQAWAAANDYESHELVKHNGRYWLALSSSTGNSPDTSDLLDWFDLGAIEE